ncbi:MAG: CotH kinase family protein [Fibrobacter sp.]|nr:CotH kinase family protein [Fibrobacter sp.]
MKKMKEGLMAQWGLAMLLAFSMATSVFAQETELVITKQPDAAYVAVADNGGTATLTFEVQGVENVSYQWYLSSDGTNENGTAIDGATESSWTTPSFDAQNNSSFYYCVATAGKKSVKSNVTMVAYTGLPTLYVNTPNGIEITEKDRWIDGTELTLKDAGNGNFEKVTTEFRGRGNSTWEQLKKPYAIKLNSKAEIMGMPKHKRWVLIANYLDNSFLKNHMAFYLSKKFELGYTVRGEFVNLVFNGVYRGLYWLGEAIKVDKNRVKIYDGEDGMDDNKDKDFLIEMDTHFDEVAKFYTPIRKMPYMVKNDDYIVEDVLNEKGKKVKDKYGNTVTQVFTVGQARLERFQNKIAALENLLYPDYETNNNCKANTNNCSAPDESYADIIDVESWAKFWLINEIMDNTELNEPKSAYFTYENKDEGDVFKAGPVWDFDAGATKALTSVKLDTSIYYNALFKSPKFIKAVKDVWNKYSSTIDFNTEIQTMRSRLATAAKLDSLMWGDHKDYLENAISGFDGNVDFLKNSLNNKKGVVGKYVNNKALEYVVQDGEVLTGTFGANDKISIADGATVTLNNVIINGVNSEDYQWAGITCLGDCEIVLAENSKNTVKGFYGHYPGIYVPKGKTLTISGTGFLDASSDGYGAGIGGGWRINCGNIEINGGTIVARGGDKAAGIGSGSEGNVGGITITDNVTKVTAIKGEYAPYSIGKGDYSSREGKISIGDVVYDNDIEESPFVYPKTTEYAAVQIHEYNSGWRAVIDGSYGKTDAVEITNEIEDVAVEYNRAFPVGAYSTIVLPFDVNTANVSGLQAVLYYNGIGKDKDGKDAIKMKVLWAEKGVIKDADGKDKEYEHTTISANTPYLVKMNKPEFKVDGKVTLKATTEAITKYPEWEWEFRGTWKYKKWESGDPELGVAYGFAASSSDDNKIQVGDFVKVGVGAWICPMRAYLVRSDVAPKAQGVRANGAYVMRPSVTQTELPEFMSIIVDNGDGDDDNAEHTTVIGHFNTRTGEIKMNYDRGKFDLKGRRVNGTNNARGAYYGKKATVLRPER